MDELKIERIDYSGDPQDVISRRITPRMLRKVDALLDSTDEKIVLAASREVKDLDKRFMKAAGGGVNMQFNFPPEYVKTALAGVGKVVAGVEVTKRLEGPNAAVDGEWVEDGE